MRSKHSAFFYPKKKKKTLFLPFFGPKMYTVDLRRKHVASFNGHDEVRLFAVVTESQIPSHHQVIIISIRSYLARSIHQELKIIGSTTRCCFVRLFPTFISLPYSEANSLMAITVTNLSPLALARKLVLMFPISSPQIGAYYDSLNLL